MKVLTVGDLKTYLEAHDLSPEKFARDVQLSHMTIRRWLKKPDSQPIPEKYYPLLASRLEVSSRNQLNVSALLDDIEQAGKNYTDIENLEGEVTQKLEDPNIDSSLSGFAKRLLKVVFDKQTQTRVRMIAIGALIYFINPVDLIPDHIPVIGYVDDLAVMTMALNLALSQGEPTGSPDKRVMT